MAWIVLPHQRCVFKYSELFIRKYSIEIVETEVGFNKYASSFFSDDPMSAFMSRKLTYASDWDSIDSSTICFTVSLMESKNVKKCCSAYNWKCALCHSFVEQRFETLK